MSRQTNVRDKLKGKEHGQQIGNGFSVPILAAPEKKRAQYEFKE